MDGYTSIKNVSILAPDFNKNPFEWKNLKLNNPRSVNFDQNNYFEQHYNNLALHNANSDDISSNFTAIGDLPPAYAKNQSILKFYGEVKNNRIAGNPTLETKPSLNPNKMIISIWGIFQF